MPVNSARLLPEQAEHRRAQVSKSEPVQYLLATLPRTDVRGLYGVAPTPYRPMAVKHPAIIAFFSMADNRAKVFNSNSYSFPLWKSGNPQEVNYHTMEKGNHKGLPLRFRITVGAIPCGCPSTT